MFTYRDFEMGTLGLAWTGDLKNAGGVCEKNGVSTARPAYFFYTLPVSTCQVKYLSIVSDDPVEDVMVLSNLDWVSKLPPN